MLFFLAASALLLLLLLRKKAVPESSVKNKPKPNDTPRWTDDDSVDESGGNNGFNGGTNVERPPVGKIWKLQTEDNWVSVAGPNGVNSGVKVGEDPAFKKKFYCIHKTTQADKYGWGTSFHLPEEVCPKGSPGYQEFFFSPNEHRKPTQQEIVFALNHPPYFGFKAEAAGVPQFAIRDSFRNAFASLNPTLISIEYDTSDDIEKCGVVKTSKEPFLLANGQPGNVRKATMISTSTGKYVIIGLPGNPEKGWKGLCRTNDLNTKCAPDPRDWNSGEYRDGYICTDPMISDQEQMRSEFARNIGGYSSSPVGFSQIWELRYYSKIRLVKIAD